MTGGAAEARAKEWARREVVNGRGAQAIIETFPVRGDPTKRASLNAGPLHPTPRSVPSSEPTQRSIRLIPGWGNSMIGSGDFS